MTVTITKPQQSSYTETEIKQGLTVLALCSGNRRRAARELEQAGKPIPAGTLGAWKQRHAGAYKRICEEELPKVYDALAEENEAIARDYLQAERILLHQLMDKRQDLEARDIANAIRNVATSKAIATDKASVIRGKPTEIREDRTLTEVARALGQYAGVVKVQGEAVDSSAVELPVEGREPMAQPGTEADER